MKKKMSVCVIGYEKFSRFFEPLFIDTFEETIVGAVLMEVHDFGDTDKC